MSLPPKHNIFDWDRVSLARFLEEKGYPAYRSRQVLQWVHRFLVDDFSCMSNISAHVRAELDAVFSCAVPPVAQTFHSSDGTTKWLFSVGEKNAIETVLIPEKTRLTLCVSSQVGCALKCAFCSTGHSGFNRNLTTGEIVAQLWWANRFLQNEHADSSSRITNVVFMGMGEPLANFEAVMRSLEIMQDDLCYGLSRRRLTVSTSGLIPAMDLMAQRCPVALAVSLHAPDDSLRDYLVPINKKYPIAQLMAACLRYVSFSPRQVITFEYVMLDGVNDTVDHAKKLILLLKNVPCKINLIPWNSFPGVSFRSSSETAVRSFLHRLADAGFVVTVRKTRGDDIDAACGQLAGQVQDRRRRVVEFRRKQEKGKLCID